MRRELAGEAAEAAKVAADSAGAFLAREAEEHRAALEALLDGLRQPFCAVLASWECCIRQGGKLLLFGNGGSAGNAQHIAAELAIRYQSDRAAIAALALTVDASTVTAAANDLGFEAVYARQVEALGRPGDVAVGISSSGRSANVLAALRVARARQLRTCGLIGGDGGAMRPLCDESIVVPSRNTARIQEMHLLVSHMLCKALEARLGLTAGVLP
ncbi:MAG TPA: SIS domain-containing protein [Steroidobacteraceae bacterium]